VVDNNILYGVKSVTSTYYEQLNEAGYLKKYVKEEIVRSMAEKIAERFPIEERVDWNKYRIDYKLSFAVLEPSKYYSLLKAEKDLGKTMMELHQLRNKFNNSKLVTDDRYKELLAAEADLKKLKEIIKGA